MAKNKWPKEIVSIFVPIFDARVHLCLSKETWKKASLYLTSKPWGDQVLRGGLLQQYDHPETGDVLYMIGVFTGDKSRTLVHELGHLVFAILNDRGISISSQDNEVYCYLLDYLFSEFQPHLKGKK